MPQRLQVPPVNVESAQEGRVTVHRLGFLDCAIIAAALYLALWKLPRMLFRRTRRRSAPPATSR